MLNIPSIQRKTASFISSELEKILETELQIGRINIGFLNRIIIDDLLVNDQQNAEMLRIARLSAKFDLLPLFNGKISISNLQLFGFNIALSKPEKEADLNLQFIIDAFKSDKPQAESKLDLRINSILIRRGRLSYDVHSQPETPEKFNPNHLRFTNIIGNLSIKALSNDSINTQIKRFSFNEESGLDLQKLSFRALGNRQGLNIENFSIALSETELKMDTIRLTYNDPEAFRNFSEEVNFSFRIEPSEIVLRDISPFAPALKNFKEKIRFSMELSGTLDDLNCPYITVDVDNYIRFKIDASIQNLVNPEDAFIFGNVSRLFIDPAGSDFIFRNLNPEKPTPVYIERMGTISFAGEVAGYFNDLVMYGNLNTSVGSARTDIKLGYDQQKSSFHYSGALKSQQFELGSLTGRPDILNKISLNIEVDGEHIATHRYPSIKAVGFISEFDYKDYTYENIELDGEFREGGFDGTVTINDDNGSLYLGGNFNIATASPHFNVKAEVNRFNPYNLHLTEKHEGSDLSFILDADFTGNSIDDMIGTIIVDSVTLVTPEETLFTETIHLEATQQENEKRLKLTSEYLHLLVKGDYSYQTLPTSIINILNYYLPSVVSRKGENESKNNFYFDLSLSNTQTLTRIFKLPFTVHTHSTIKGFVHDNSGKLRLEGYFPRFSIGNSTFESGVLICDNPKDYLNTHIRAGGRMKNGAALNISLRNQAKEDQLTTTLSWGNNGVTTYSGELTAISDFLKNPEKNSPLNAYIQIEPTIAILNDSIWNIESSYIRIDSGKVDINNFRVSHKDQHLTIHGRASTEVTDTVKVNLNDIEIGFIFDIVNIQAVDFDGIATGELTANQLLKTPIMNTELEIKNLHFNDGLLGDMFVDGRWDHVNEGIDLYARIYEDTIAKTEVTGLISIGQKGLDLHIDAEGTNIEFLQKYMEVVASDVAGRAYGKARLHGSFKDLNLEGSLLADAAFKIDILNTRFAIRDTVRLLPDQVAFQNVTIRDPEGNRGTVNGALYHQHLRDLTYSIQANVDNMLVMNTQEDPDLPFYGTAYVTGTAFIRGGGNELNVDVAVTSNRNTQMVYTTGNAATATNSEFIRFVDKTPRRTLPDTLPDFFSDNTFAEEAGEEMDIRLNILVDATPDATIRIIMDPVAGDYISGRGSGSLRLDFYNKGDVRMFGSYIINQGVYKFSLQEVIRKDFIIRNGSTIVFNGDPLNANLDVTAAYTVNGVSLSDLSEDITSMTGGQNRAKVDCVMNLSGILVQPTISLNIELPTENDAVQRAVQSYINTDEERNMQILYLLGIGKFYTLDYANQNSNAMSSVLSSTLSGQLNNALSQIIDNSNWNIGTNLSTGSGGWTEMEVEGMLSGQLLNNRLLINGNFGYRETLSSTTNFVGDFDVEYLLTPSGNIRLKGYNKTNDRFYAQKTLTTQGLGVGYKKEFNRWREFWIWNRKQNNTPQQTEKETTEKEEE